jgi:hypothetical protein
MLNSILSKYVIDSFSISLYGDSLVFNLPLKNWFEEKAPKIKKSNVF